MTEPINNKPELNTSNLAIKSISILGGFLSMGAIVGLIFLMGIFDSLAGTSLIALVFWTISFFGLRLSESFSLDSFFLSLYLTSFVFFFISLDKLNMTDKFSYLSMIGIGLVSLFLVRNFIAAFLTTILILLNLSTFIGLFELEFLLHLYFSLMVLIGLLFLDLRILPNIPRGEGGSSPVFLGIFCSLMILLPYTYRTSLIYKNLDYPWILGIVLFLGIIYSIYALSPVFRNSTNTFQWIGLGILALSILPFVISPPNIGSMLVIIIGFHSKSRFIFFLGILSLIGNMIDFYYNLDFTLLTKSLLLMGSGLWFLFIYALITKRMDSHE